jgi:putative PEP-CTERM system TPR-repeat lipoprotein
VAGHRAVQERGRARLLLRWTACLVLAAALGGCGKDDPAALVASAKEYARKGDHRAAVIQLKNALQRRPVDGEARFLLGQALLEIRDPAGAEKELRRARETGAPEAGVAPLLARSLVEQREFDAVIKEFGARRYDDRAVEGRIRTFVGEAHLARGRPQDAAAAFADALRAVPGFVPARLGQARIAFGAARLDEAMKLVEAAVADAPGNVEALLMKADLQWAGGDRAGARSTVTGALKTDPSALAAHFALVSLWMEEAAFEQAAAQLDAARRIAGGDLRIAYFDGLLAFRRNELARAREHILQVLKYVPDHMPGLVLAGAIELQAGNTASAQNYLRRALTRSTSHGGARRLLVAALLRSGQPTRALEALVPLITADADPSPALLLLAGETYLANGDLKRAAVYFEQAAKTDGQGVAARTRLAQIAIARGDAETGLRDLEAAAGADPKQNQADIALVLGRLRRGEGAKALAAARALADKQPKDPVSFQVLGAVQLTRRDRAAARESFERALALSPGYLPAAVSLAGIDLAEQKPDAARSRFTAMLTREPKNEQIVLAQAEFEARAGSPAKVVAGLLQNAVSVNPESPNAHIARISHFLRNKDPRAALTAAQQAAAAIPDDARVVEVLAQAQEAAGETNQAVESLNRLAAMLPATPGPLLRLAALHTRAGNQDRAVDALKRAQRIAPDDHRIDRDLVGMLLAKGQPDKALQHARDLQARAPRHATGFVLEGDVLAAQRRFADAERVYRAALKIEAAGAIAGKVVTVMEESGRRKEAAAFAAKWIAEQPRDVVVRMLLAGRALRARELQAAAAHYAAVLAVDPNQVIALNNLAWIGGETGDPKALGYAERAARLAPQQPTVLDTLGMLLVKRGDTERGLKVLEQANRLAPARVDLRMNRARALAMAGQKDAARRELQAIVDTRDEIPEKRAAAELLKTL